MEEFREAVHFLINSSHFSGINLIIYPLLYIMSILWDAETMRWEHHPHGYVRGGVGTSRMLPSTTASGSPPSRTGASPQAGIELPQFGKSVPSFTHRSSPRHVSTRPMLSLYSRENRQCGNRSQEGIPDCAVFPGGSTRFHDRPCALPR